MSVLALALLSGSIYYIYTQQQLSTHQLDKAVHDLKQSQGIETQQLQNQIKTLKAQVQAKAIEKQRLASVQAAQALVAPAPIQVATKTAIEVPVAPNIVNTSLAQWLYTLRMCESSGNYQENTGNGFYGAYQFSINTWDHWNTGYSRADLAPAAIQDVTIIKNTLSTQGLITQNPGCYHKGNLSNYPPS